MKNTKRIVAVTGAIMILFSVICIPAYADNASSGNINPEYTFENQPIPVVAAGSSVATIGQNGLNYGANASGTSYFVAAHDNPNVYMFMYKVPNYDDLNYAIVSENSFTFSIVRSNSSQSGYVNVNSNIQVSGSLNEYGFVTYTHSSGTVQTWPDIYIPLYETREEGYQALRDFLDNPPVSETPHQINYSIPAGYVAFFDIHGLSNIRGSVKAFSAVALTPQQWASTNVLYGYTSNIPSSFSLPLNGSTSYSWNAGKTNIFGKSQNWSWLGVYSGNNNYLFISNPTYSNVTGVMDNGQSMIVDNPSATNSYVDVFLDQAYSVKLVSLNAVITYDPQNGNYGGIDDGNGDTTYDVEYNDESQQWVTIDQNGTPVGPEGIPIGGDNSIDTPSEFGNIAAWLENIAHQISAFFTGAIGAVTTLVNAGSAFIHQLISLYSWLPAPVYAVLSSALILVITIGVIKVFI